MIEYNTIPVYNYSYVANTISPLPVNLAVFTDAYRKLPVWTCTDWITFFNKLEKKYGEEKAKQIWANFWILGLSKSAGGKGDLRAGSGLAYDSVPLDCRSFNSDFRNFIEKYKLKDVVYKGLGVIAIPIGAGAEIVEDVAGAIGNTAKTLKFIMPVALIGLGVLAFIWGYNKIK